MSQAAVPQYDEEDADELDIDDGGADELLDLMPDNYDGEDNSAALGLETQMSQQYTQARDSLNPSIFNDQVPPNSNQKQLFDSELNSEFNYGYDHD